MVQQLLLTANVDADQLSAVKLALRALTGLNPEPLARHTVIMKPKFPYTPEKVRGKTDQVESYRIRLCRVWNKGLEKDKEGPFQGESITDTSKDSTRNESIWTIQLRDIPAGGKHTTSIQNIYEATIYKTDDICGYLDELGYMPETQLWASGVRFYYNQTVVVEIFRFYTIDESRKVVIDVKEQGKDVDSNGLVNLKLLDPSGRYVVKCFVNITKVNDLDNVARGVKQLEILQKELSGLVDLHVPDRTAMDSRLNSRIASVRRQV